MTTTPAPVQKSRRWPWVVGAVLLLVIFANMGDDESSGTVQDAAAAYDNATVPYPTAAPAPTAVIEQPQPSVVVPAPAPVPAPEPVATEPDMTVSQSNAVGKAESYLDFSSFSRSGLIDQLEFEEFTPAQAEHGANSVGL